MQMEGIIRDVGPASPFSRASIADPITLAGHPDSLPLLLDRFLTRQGHRPSLAVTTKSQADMGSYTDSRWATTRFLGSNQSQLRGLAEAQHVSTCRG
jgi:hypothetical protein